MPPTTNTPDLLIVGAGVIGLATAWRAAAAGMRVVVLERDRPGAGTSTVAAGILSPSTLSAWQGDAGAMHASAMRRWPSFAQELERASGMPVPYRAEGILRLASDDEHVEELAALHALQREQGIESIALTAAQALELEPLVTPPLAALVEPDSASIATPAYVAALVRACDRAGVAIVSGIEVAGLLVEGGRCVGVRDADGAEHRATTSLVAAGSWCAQIAGLADHCDAVVRPSRGQVLHVRSVEQLTRHVLYGYPGSIVPRAGNQYVLAATIEDVGFVSQPTDAGIQEVLTNATRVLPAIAGARVEEIRVGFRPVTQDEQAFVGATRLDGLLVATGHYRNGTLASPAVADEVVALLG
jgi:glycine oxidase